MGGINVNRVKLLRSDAAKVLEVGMGDPLSVQWLRLHTSISGPQVQSQMRELRFHISGSAF